MDYINLPRQLIYKQRNNLKDFGVQIPGTMNNLLFSNLKELFKATDRVKELMLRCFNNAYYICTLIPFLDFPELQVDEYEKILIKNENYAAEEICAISMAMVCKLLPACDARWRPENSDLIEKIVYRFTHYRWWGSGSANEFKTIAENNNTDGLIIPQKEFDPRDIIEVIETFSVGELRVYAEYICERLAKMEDPHKRMLGFNTAKLRIEKYQRELCENTEYEPKKDSFKNSRTEGMPIIRDLNFEEQVRNCYKESKEALKYYKEHYPKADNCHLEKHTDSAPTVSYNTVIVAGNEQLRQQLSQSTNENYKLEKENAELKEKHTQQTITTYGEAIEELKNTKQLLSEKETIIKEQELLIKDYSARFDPKDLKKKKYIAMTGKQHVILFLAVLAHHDRLPNSRRSMSFLMSFIAARSESTMEDYLGDAISEDECEALAQVFQNEKQPFIASLIRELPDKLEKDKSKKNRKKALKKSN